MQCDTPSFLVYILISPFLKSPSEYGLLISRLLFHTKVLISICIVKLILVFCTCSVLFVISNHYFCLYNNCSRAPRKFKMVLSCIFMSGALVCSICGMGKGNALSFPIFLWKHMQPTRLKTYWYMIWHIFQRNLLPY